MFLQQGTRDMANVMDIILAAVDEYISDTIRPGTPHWTQYISSVVPSDGSVCWCMIDGNVLTIAGELRGGRN